MSGPDDPAAKHGARAALPTGAVFKRIVAAASSFAALPGLLSFIVYGLVNHCFAYVAQNLATMNLAFVSIVVMVVLAACSAVSAFGSLCLIILLVWLRPRRRGVHVFLPRSRGLQAVIAFGSLLVLVSGTMAGIRNFMSISDHASAYLLIYLFAVGFLIIGAADPMDGQRETLRQNLRTLTLLSLGMLPMQLSLLAPSVNIFFRIMGMRSGPEESVFVDDAAHQRIAGLAALADVPDPACRVSAGGRTGWRLPHGIVILRGVGASTLVATGSASLPVLALQSTQVETLLLHPKPPASCGS